MSHPKNTNGSKPGQMKSENRIIINVSGYRFETYKNTLKNIPDTRLAWLTETTSNSDFDYENGEYFFDRHPDCFAMVLNYYRTGKLHTPLNVCGPMFEEELAFWGIDEKQIESCCWTTYRTHRNAQETLAKLNEDDEHHDESETDDNEDIARRFGIEEESKPVSSNCKKFQHKVWNYLDYNRNSGKIGLIINVISILFIVVSILVLCLGTVSELRVVRDKRKNISEIQVKPIRTYLEETLPHRYLIYCDLICMTYFTIEFLARVTFTPRKWDFFYRFLTLLDIAAILSGFIRLGIQFNDTPKIPAFIEQLLNLPSLMRILKVARHLSGLKILLHTIKASAKELLLLFTVFSIFVIIMGFISFVGEMALEKNENNFYNIPISLWWAMITMTTVGYGDMVPVTVLGYIVGSITAAFGVLVIALPVPIIVNNFALFYSHAQARLKQPKRNKRALVGAHDWLKQAPLNQSPTFFMQQTSTKSKGMSIVEENSNHQKFTFNGVINNSKKLKQTKTDSSFESLKETQSCGSNMSDLENSNDKNSKINVIYVDEYEEDLEFDKKIQTKDDDRKMTKKSSIFSITKEVIKLNSANGHVTESVDNSTTSTFKSIYNRHRKALVDVRNFQKRKSLRPNISVIPENGDC